MADTAGGETFFWRWAALLAAAGFVLRLYFAGGPLWIDELVSLSIATSPAGIGGILAPNDNNHLLNTLWLHAMGADAPVRLLRALSIAFGTATVPMAGLLLARRGKTAAVAGMVLAAVAYPLVVYGSEARGYAGYIFATFLLLVAVERALDCDPNARWLAAVATVLGLACHVLFVFSGLAAGLIALSSLARGAGDADTVVRRMVAIFAPSLAAGVVWAACAVALVAKHGVVMGAAGPFTLPIFWTGYGGVLSAFLGGPDGLPLWLCGLSAAAIAVVVWRWPRSGHDRALIACGLVAVTLAMAALRPPNTEYPRYHMLAGMTLLIAMAIATATLAVRGPRCRAAAYGLMGVVLAGHAARLYAFDVVRRGDVAAHIAVAGQGFAAPLRIGSDADGRTPYLLDGARRQAGLATRYIPEAEWCASPPDVVLISILGGVEPKAAFRAEQPGCSLSFERVATEGRFGLSGLPLAYYRRTP